MNTYQDEKGRAVMDGYMKVDTTSEQQRLQVLDFRIGLYNFVEITMYLVALILFGGVVTLLLVGIASAASLLLGVIGLLLISSGYYTRLTRHFAVDEVKAIKAAIEPVKRSRY
jgi:hypothetical protein